MKTVDLIKIRLDILATSDVHGVILPTNETEKSGSLCQMHSLVTDLRQTHQNCLLLDNGDFLQGTPVCDFAAENSTLTDGTHPVMLAMNHMGYDAAGLGNHEFDYGLPFLERCVARADFPIIGSNIQYPDQNWLPRKILEQRVIDQTGRFHMMRIGLMSLLPEQVTAWNARHLRDRVQTFDIVETAISAAEALRAEGADLVICLLHSGIGASDWSPRLENAALPISELADIDAMICGHTHRLLPDPTMPSTDAINYRAGYLHGIPTVMPGFNGSKLGHISLQIEMMDRRAVITQSDIQLHNTTDATLDPDLKQSVLPMHLACQKTLNRTVGNTDIPIHSYYSRLPGDPSVAVSATAQLHYARTHLMDNLPDDLPLLSAASPFKGGGRGGPDNFVHVDAGMVSKSDLNRLHPFQNALVALRMTGAQIRDWLEMSASNFNRIRPNSNPARLRDPQFPCYGFDTIFGITYAFDLSQPARFDVQGKRISESNRVRALRFKGVDITDNQQFTLLTNSYRAGGGGNFPHATTTSRIKIPLCDSRQLLENYLKNGIRDADLPPSPWRFHAITDGSALVEIGPKALSLLSQGHVPDLPLRTLSRNVQGFLECQISLSQDAAQLACIP
ncbi:MAG: 5'-nucleotidase C-terminal domain-containing protein [Cognatishimia sp.]|uniref:5'-nucleotidase C-terminal domain-containing protein n=1 Tax=Cognatishimia sp. TaxID=2211648 RepID=UPI003B8DB5DB